MATSRAVRARLLPTHHMEEIVYPIECPFRTQLREFGNRHLREIGAVFGAPEADNALVRTASCRAPAGGGAVFPPVLNAIAAGTVRTRAAWVLASGGAVDGLGGTRQAGSTYPVVVLTHQPSACSSSSHSGTVHCPAAGVTGSG